MSKRGENIYKRKDGRWEGRYIKGRKVDGKIQYGYIYSNSYKTTQNKPKL
ncbi:Phage integrase family protein [Lactococcus piscium MKFS47]|uniref:Phage integrase family protein n=1 Tax=Pseudolactococcus piscium MKFS47 TaxID=297352 RepID=A0A0D6DVD5_9LACT|nr:Phage integrase family protein [Lactococcus piscium MKFS47]